MKKSDFRGTKQVFSFTLTQYLKSRATLTMLFSMLLVSAVCIFSLFMSADEITSPATPSGLTHIRLENATELDIRVEDIAAAYPSGTLINEVGGELGPHEALITVSLSDNGSLCVEISLSDNSTVSESEAMHLSMAADHAVTLACYRANGITDSQLSSILSDVYVSTDTVSNYIDAQTEAPAGDVPGLEDGSFFILSYAYSIIVLMLVMFSTSFIIQSVVEEKASKLVELLMVSVKPLALILGKILATMLFMSISLLTLLAGAALTTAIMSNFVDVSSVMASLSASGIDFTLSLRIILTIPAVLISIILGYLTFSLIGGVLGACCSKLEDIGAATGGVSLIVLSCYLLTTVGSAAGSRAFVIFCSLCPFVSVFSAPVSYLTGVIGFGTLALSWLIQAAVIVCVALFCARVYGTLIIHRGNRIKLKALISIAKRGGNAQ